MIGSSGLSAAAISISRRPASRSPLPNLGQAQAEPSQRAVGFERDRTFERGSGF